MGQNSGKRPSLLPLSGVPFQALQAQISTLERLAEHLMALGAIEEARRALIRAAELASGEVSARDPVNWIPPEVALNKQRRLNRLHQPFPNGPVGNCLKPVDVVQMLLDFNFFFSDPLMAQLVVVMEGCPYPPAHHPLGGST